MDGFDKLDALMEGWDYKPSPRFVSLPKNEMKEIIDNSPEHQVHIFSADIQHNDSLNQDEVAVLLWTGGEMVMSTLSFECFTPQEGSSSPMPDFDKMSIGEYGHELVLGEYEAAADALLVDDKEDWHWKPPYSIPHSD